MLRYFPCSSSLPSNWSARALRTNGNKQLKTPKKLHQKHQIDNKGNNIVLMFDFKIWKCKGTTRDPKTWEGIRGI